MQLTELKQRFYTIVSPSLPNEWEVEDVLLTVLELSDEHVDLLLGQVAVIWPVSHSLCFAYLQDGVKCISIIPDSLVAEWSRRILSLYETGGLLAARKFMADPKRLFLGVIDGMYGVSFLQVRDTMQLYLSGISGAEIELGVANVPKTDTTKIYVPEFLDVFQEQVENSLLYKFLISLQWAHVESRFYENALGPKNSQESVATLFGSVSGKQKAEELFLVAQCVSSVMWLQEKLPGVIRSMRPLYLQMVEAVTAGECSPAYCEAVKIMLRLAIVEDPPEEDDARLNCDMPRLLIRRLRTETAFEVLPDLCKYYDGFTGSCEFGDFWIILGGLDFDAASVALHRRRTDEKNAFLSLMSFAIEKNSEKSQTREGAKPEQKAEGTRLVISIEDKEQDSHNRDELLVENGLFELSDELRSLIESIENDLGELPEAYVQAASGMAGKGVNSRETENLGNSGASAHLGMIGHSYDEWDYRRGGYRQAWCTLYEKNVNPVKSTFIPETLVKYKGQLHRIRRQFEMLRNQNRFLRRRRYGDDIDFDALVDALGDQKAGLVPSDRLFLRLLRDRREICSYFLVDMSNSTEGWVGTAVKESLVLMAEAMDIVGDPYAIYGFSGMRRSKSEVYPIKELLEPYTQEVKERISGIGPKEYTRMGPPIRHITKKILSAESRIRLLIVFSDGKPEDYDDYKGKYAIEDTRKAILEARGAGVQVFCVTIDKSAHEYLGHMFGRGQFVFIDNVEALPGKLVEMYRLLTC